MRQPMTNKIALSSSKTEWC